MRDARPREPINRRPHHRRRTTGRRFEVQPVRAASSDPYVAKITVKVTEDGKVYEWLIRRSELDEDLREMRKQDLQAMIDALRKSKAKP